MLINLTPILQATTAAWETRIYIASECQAQQVEARAPLGMEQGGKWSFFPLWMCSLNSWVPRGRRMVKCREEEFSHFENNILNN